MVVVMTDAYIPWSSVKSSNIEALAYNLTEKKMYVRFKSGSEYSYKNVPADVFQSISGARSVGSTFSTLVRSKPDEFPYTKIK